MVVSLIYFYYCLPLYYEIELSVFEDLRLFSCDSTLGMLYLFISNKVEICRLPLQKYQQWFNVKNNNATLHFKPKNVDFFMKRIIDEN